MRIRHLVQDCHDYALKQGFWGAPVNKAEKLCLIHSEVSEALEALREGKPMDEELADIIIRVCDLAGYEGINLEKAIEDKMAVNRTRPYKHGREF